MFVVVNRNLTFVSNKRYLSLPLAVRLLNCFCLTLMLTLLLIVSSSFQPSSAFSNRHVAFLNRYDSVEGPHFTALFDEIFEQTGFEQKRVAFLSLSSWSLQLSLPLSSSQSSLSTTPSSLRLDQRQEKIAKDLEFTHHEHFFLDKLNPLQLEEHFDRFQPTIIWLCGKHVVAEPHHQESLHNHNDVNAFQLRYLLRTSGLDMQIESLCGAEDRRSTLFIGEGNAAVCCAGADMAVAAQEGLGHDPKGAPEPQYRGLELLGDQRSFLYGNLQINSNTTTTSSQRIEHPGRVKTLKDDQVFVWSQTKQDGTYSFCMNARQKGAIESLCHPPALQSMQELDLGGRQCTGEPSIDPSRRLQMTGDSEWFEEGG